MKSLKSPAIMAAVSIALGCGSTAKFTGDARTDTGVDTGPDTVDVTPDGPGIQRAVDILVVVDNSMSMAEEQARLVENFPKLIEGLLDPATDDEPVTDLHLGVVSTDMGTGGYTVDTCHDPVDGDDGILQNNPTSLITDCEASYPEFLSYDSDTPDADLISWLTLGFACIATLGIDGCGFEQQLEAARKALIDHAEGPNSGFLRPDSILAVLFLSDEDDCSVAAGQERIFDVTDSSLGGMNLRCHNHPEMLVPHTSYRTDFGSLRANPVDLLLGFIVGVPQDDVCEGSGNRLGECLDHPDMHERVDPVSGNRLVPSCESSGAGTQAYPARRFVEVAVDFGAQSYVQSICDTDFSPTVDWLMTSIQTVAGG
jgi:hypothetical protein